ncbi:mannose-1-phosphate guanylyltransferase [Tessaracoccus caeni]|uniref:mannose-1-phosphate guanylyltransferase n=1 Tax=Tessaracoccus caeni TaxID=3031239 RepID=UPI0023DA08D9|nr:mannose-1-phosphate guanylyltransferase [Tessaracoccus caeni]MDF1488917.1 mannose-1-phosphate guanylyltransferase [Tessaracoccus caeni]
MRYVVIMAGGSGTRLWPLSRKGKPKQLLDLFEGRSLLRTAYERVAGLVDAERVLVVCGRAYADDVTEQLPELPAGNVLGEPEGRDSLNAVAWSVAEAARRDPEAVVAVVTADQVITPIDEFQHSLDRAFEVAEARPEALVTLGVVPTSPHTGYGYLQRGDALDGFPDVCRVVEFKEKPERAVAEEYLASGRYWWNAGMFVWRAETLLRQLRLLLPEEHDKIVRLVAHPELLDQIFPTLKKTSIDYAIMEPVSQGKAEAAVYAVGLHVDWRDIGGFVSLAELFATDAAGNAVQGRTVTLDASGCVLVNASGRDHVIAALGLKDTLVVATPTATLACALSDGERIRELVERVRDEAGVEFS